MQQLGKMRAWTGDEGPVMNSFMTFLRDEALESHENVL